MQTLWQDLRYSVRMLLKNPGFTLIAVITLALGIGANTAIFSVVNAVVLKPLPYPDSHRLVTITGASAMFRQEAVTPADFVQWRAQQQSFAALFAYTGAPANLTGGSQPVRVRGVTVSEGFFDVLRTQPVVGRAFTPEEHRPGRTQVAVISHAIWQKHFGGEQNVVGQTLRLDGESYSVVGVMPTDFKFTQPADVITPFALDPTSRANSFLRVIARLRDGVTRAQARAETRLIAERLQQADAQPAPGARRDEADRLGADLTPLHELTRENSQRGLWILLGATAFVLLIACANLANLLLGRAATRRREMAVRAALGAGRWRLLRQALTESLLLACLGGAGGTLLAWWGVDALLAFAPQTLPRLNVIGVDAQTLGFTLLTSLLTSLLFGLAPALQSSKLDLTQALKEGGQVARGGRAFSLRSLLVVGEVALALVLLVGAGLLLGSFVRLLRVDPGFAPESLLTVDVALPETYRTKEQIASFYEQSLARIGALPGVQAVGAINLLPLGEMLLRGSFVIEGQPAPAEDAPNWAVKPAVSGDYFRAMNISLRQGRTFTTRDTAETPGVVVVSESVARRYFADGNSVGRRISFDRDRNQQPVWLEVVGVVGDVKQEALGAETRPTIYAPATQVPRLFMLRDLTYAVRTAVEPASLIAAVEREIQATDPELPVVAARTMQQVVAASVSEPRFNALLLGLFALLALALAATGLYGVMSYFVTQRTHEIGIRMALGAASRDVLRLVIGQGMTLTVIGVLIGLAASFALTRAMKSLLFEVSPTDPLTFAVIAVTLLLVALLACWIPARRATKVDPMIALRCD